MSKPDYVLVLDTNRKPLNPCTPGVARSLLKSGKAKVFRRFPFTIILNKAIDGSPEPMKLKLDPGYALLNINNKQQQQRISFLAECKDR